MFVCFVSDSTIHLSASSSWLAGETWHFEVIWLYRAKKASLSDSVHIKLLPSPLKSSLIFLTALLFTMWFFVACMLSDSYSISHFSFGLIEIVWTRLGDYTYRPSLFGESTRSETCSNASTFFFFALVSKKIFQTFCSNNRSCIWEFHRLTKVNGTWWGICPDRVKWTCWYAVKQSKYTQYYTRKIAVEAKRQRADVQHLKIIVC